MVNLHIDSYYLACPALAEGESKFLEYASSLLDWKEMQKSKGIKFYLSTNSLKTLHSEMKYPFLHDLKTSLEHFSINYIQSKDLNIIADSFLTKSSSVESELKFDDILIEHQKLLLPKVLPKRVKVFQDDYLHTASLVALHHLIFDYNIDKSFILSRDVVATDRTISAENEVAMVEPTGVFEPHCLPIKIISNVPVIDGYCELLQSLNLESLLCSREFCEEQILFAIKVAIYTTLISIGQRKKWEDLPVFSVNKVFAKTIKELKLHFEVKKLKGILRVCVEMLLGINLKGVHELRTGAGGGNPPKKRGDYIAQRADIDYEHHLHFWKNGSNIEFASVVVHNDFSIPE